MNKRFITIVAGLLALTSSFAQTYWQEPIDTVSVPGYYNIELSQEIAGLGLKTLRIFDVNDTEIPYLVRSSVPVKEMKQIEMYDLVSNTQRDSINTIIVHNEEPEVSRFYLLMKEAEVTKFISIRGSYDRKQWFSVKQKSTLRTEHNPTLGEIAIVDFPKGDYTYYELVVSNNSPSPLNITGVGKMQKENIYGRFVQLNVGAFISEEDDKGNTIITFPSMQYPYYLSRLELDVKGKGHFSRKVRIDKPGRYALQKFQLTSREEPVFYFDNLLINKDVQIIIENENNLPLKVTDARLFGLSRFLCAYLDAHTQYRVETDDFKHKYYDIEGFANEIPYTLPVIKTGEIREVEEEPERELRFYEKPMFLWSIIVLTGIGLFLICIKMIRELKKKE